VRPQRAVVHAGVKLHEPGIDVWPAVGPPDAVYGQTFMPGFCARLLS
jgi:hypothetical protein